MPRPLTLNVTLPNDAFALVKQGSKRMVSTKRNPRKDRYFLNKKPANIKINGVLYTVSKVEITPDLINVRFR